MQLMPNWFYGFVPPGWWPDRPREPFFFGLNVLTLVPNTRPVVEQVFSKREDVLLFGGCVLVTDTVVPATIHAPVSGISSQVYAFSLRSPSGNIDYLGGQAVPATLQFAVPIESIFSAWQFVARRPVFWPFPIAIPKGGSLQMELINTGAVNKDVRFAFWTSLIYKDREFAA